MCNPRTGWEDARHLHLGRFPVYCFSFFYFFNPFIQIKRLLGLFQPCHRLRKSPRINPRAINVIAHIWLDSSDQRENPERIDATLKKEPTENAEANEPADPIDRTEPADPIDKMELEDPIDKMEAEDPMLRNDSEESNEPDDDRSSGPMQALSQQPEPPHQ